jgi:predicted amidohydrolase
MPPGTSAVTVPTPLGRLGLSICYDMRFPALYEALGRARCDMIAIPAAFTVPTGKAHWHLMQRARAVEASAYSSSPPRKSARMPTGAAPMATAWSSIPGATSCSTWAARRPGLGFAEIDRADCRSARAAAQPCQSPHYRHGVKSPHDQTS